MNSGVMVVMEIAYLTSLPSFMITTLIYVLLSLSPMCLGGGGITPSGHEGWDPIFWLCTWSDMGTGPCLRHERCQASGFSGSFKSTPEENSSLSLSMKSLKVIGSHFATKEGVVVVRMAVRLTRWGVEQRTREEKGERADC